MTSKGDIDAWGRVATGRFKVVVWRVRCGHIVHGREQIGSLSYKSRESAQERLDAFFAANPDIGDLVWNGQVEEIRRYVS